MARQMGYNFLMKLNNKTLIGETQTDLSISARTKDSIVKADKGNSQSVVVGADITFNVNGLVELKGGDGTTSQLDGDDLLEISLKKGAEAIVPFVYTRGDLKSYQGNCIITSYSESSNSEDEVTYTLALKVSGAMTAVSSVAATVSEEGAE